MNQNTTLEEFRRLAGKVGMKRKDTKAKRDRDLALMNLIIELEQMGIEFGGRWNSKMEVKPSTLYLEYVFSTKRRFRADLAIPTERLLVEIHGGSYVVRRSKDGKVHYLGGAHHSPEGRRRDMDKSNLANLEGWTYLEVDWKDVKMGSAFDLIQQALGVDKNEDDE